MKKGAENIKTAVSTVKINKSKIPVPVKPFGRISAMTRKLTLVEAAIAEPPEVINEQCETPEPIVIELQPNIKPPERHEPIVKSHQLIVKSHQLIVIESPQSLANETEPFEGDAQGIAGVVERHEPIDKPPESIVQSHQLIAIESPQPIGQ